MGLQRDEGQDSSPAAVGSIFKPSTRPNGGYFSAQLR